MSGSNLSAVSFSVKAPSGKIVTCSYGRPVLGSSPSIIGEAVFADNEDLGFLKFVNLFISSTSFRILKRQQSGRIHHPLALGYSSETQLDGYRHHPFSSLEGCNTFGHVMNRFRTVHVPSS